MASFKIVIIIAIIALLNSTTVANDSSSTASTGIYAGTSGIYAGTKSWGIDVGTLASSIGIDAGDYTTGIDAGTASISIELDNTTTDVTSEMATITALGFLPPESRNACSYVPGGTSGAVVYGTTYSVPVNLHLCFEGDQACWEAGSRCGAICKCMAFVLIHAWSS
jgi:hypothetical protein